MTELSELSERFAQIFEKRKQRILLLSEAGNNELEKKIFLQIIDLNWKNHIQYLVQLRQVIGLRSYGQKDPLIEYKKEAFSLFENLLDKLKFDFLSILSNMKIVDSQVIKKESKNEILNAPKIDQKNSGRKMKRNEPCFCGSGKKYKHCCGAL